MESQTRSTPTAQEVNQTTKKGHDTNPSPGDYRNTHEKTKIGYGDVFKPAEPANSAARDSSPLRTIPRARELPWYTCRHHEPRTAAKAELYRAESSASLTGPGSSKKRSTYCPGVEMGAESFPGHQR